MRCPPARPPLRSPARTEGRARPPPGKHGSPQWEWRSRKRQGPQCYQEGCLRAERNAAHGCPDCRCQCPGP
eukprot:11573823-Alexandrium_andersonii.AAC.1